MFQMNIFECSADSRIQSSIFKVCMVLNAELNIDPTAQYSRLVFSNAELKVDPIAGYSSVYGVECRAERRSHISIFKVCMLVNAELNFDPTP